MYTIAAIGRSLGWSGAPMKPASECCIFLVVRDEPDGNEVRSIRTALKIPLEGVQKQQQDLESKLERRHQDLESKIEKIETKLESKIEKVEHTMSQIHELLLEVTRTGRRNSAEEPEGPPPTAPPPLPLHHQDLESKFDNMERRYQDLESKIAQIQEVSVEVTWMGRRNFADEPLRETAEASPQIAMNPFLELPALE